MEITKKIINKLFKKYFEKKSLMIGRSHLLNARHNYKKIENLNDLDYKIFSQFGEDGLIHDIWALNDDSDLEEKLKTNKSLMHT